MTPGEVNACLNKYTHKKNLNQKATRGLSLSLVCGSIKYPDAMEAHLETFSIRFFMENPQTRMSRDYGLAVAFAVHVWKAGKASSGKWLTARFFATKNCTASRSKARSSFLYLSAMCLLDYWTRIKELIIPVFWAIKGMHLDFDEKQHGTTKQWKPC